MGWKCEGERRVTYIQINRKMALCMFSCTSLTADQQCKLIEREEKPKIACDRTIGMKWYHIGTHWKRVPGQCLGETDTIHGSYCHASPAPVQARDPPDDATQPYVPETPVMWIPSYRKEVSSEEKGQHVEHKMSHKRRQYPHPKTPNRLIDPLTLQQSVLSPPWDDRGLWLPKNVRICCKVSLLVSMSYRKYTCDLCSLLDGVSR